MLPMVFPNRVKYVLFNILMHRGNKSGKEARVITKLVKSYFLQRGIKVNTMRSTNLMRGVMRRCIYIAESHKEVMGQRH